MLHESPPPFRSTATWSSDAVGAPEDSAPRSTAGRVPGLTACSLCSGETLGADDPLDGGQTARLQGLARAGAARLTFVECLDECERGDVVVARPTPSCRSAGATPVWFERLAGDDVTAELEGWLQRGGPGASPLPSALSKLVIPRETQPESE